MIFRRKKVSDYTVEYACVNAKGNVRPSNQDNFYVLGRYRHGDEKLSTIEADGTFASADHEILALYDGMGGEACGDMAALIAASATAEFNHMPGEGSALLTQMALTLNSYVCEFARINNIGSTGSTLAAIRFAPEGICCCNLGDSRIFHIRKNSIRQISVDHVMQNYPRKKAPLTQYLGFPTDEISLEPHTVKQDYVSDDLFLLCSDGITDMLSNEDILRFIRNSSTTQQAVSELYSEAMQNGGIDNITVILCKIK